MAKFFICALALLVAQQVAGQNRPAPNDAYEYYDDPATTKKPVAGAAGAAGARPAVATQPAVAQPAAQPRPATVGAAPSTGAAAATNNRPATAGAAQPVSQQAAATAQVTNITSTWNQKGQCACFCFNRPGLVNPPPYDPATAPKRGTKPTPVQPPPGAPQGPTIFTDPVFLGGPPLWDADECRIRQSNERQYDISFFCTCCCPR